MKWSTSARVDFYLLERQTRACSSNAQNKEPQNTARSSLRAAATLHRQFPPVSKQEDDDAADTYDSDADAAAYGGDEL